MEHLPLLSRIAISGTCQRLRNISLSALHLWSNVYAGPVMTFYPDGALERQHPTKIWTAVSAMIGRSGRCMGEISIAFETSSFADTWAASELLGAVIVQAAKLDLIPFGRGILRVYREDDRMEPKDVMTRPAPNSWSSVSASLCAPAPSLGSFSVCIPDGFQPSTVLDTESYPLHPGTLGGVCGQLRSCYLHGVILPLEGCRAFAALTLFDYQPVPVAMTAAGIAQILELMPQLDTLGLTLQFPRGEPFNGPSPVHQRLARVAARFPSPSTLVDESSDIVDFFSQVTSATVVLDLRSVRPFSWYECVLPRQLQQPAEVAADHRVTVARVQKLAVLVKPAVLLKELMADAALAKVVALTISEEWWQDSGFPPAPQLRQLRIQLVACSYLPPDDDIMIAAFGISVFTSGEEHTPWQCPQLEELCFVYRHTEFCSMRPVYDDRDFTCACQNGCVMSLADVAHFVRMRLQFSARKLRQLILPCLQALADPDPAAAFAVLLDLAEEVLIDETIPPELKELDGYDSQAFAAPLGPSRLFESSHPNSWINNYMDSLGTFLDD